jgi:hypothetical protein
MVIIRIRRFRERCAVFHALETSEAALNLCCRPLATYGLSRRKLLYDLERGSPFISTLRTHQVAHTRTLSAFSCACFESNTHAPSGARATRAFLSERKGRVVVEIER